MKKKKPEIEIVSGRYRTLEMMFIRQIVKWGECLKDIVSLDYKIVVLFCRTV